MIRVEGTVTRVERADFDISEKELLKSLSKLNQVDVLNQVRKNFAKECTGYSDAFIWNNTWQVYVNNGNHYSGDEKIRDATPEEKEFYFSLAELMEKHNWFILQSKLKGKTA